MTYLYSPHLPPEIAERLRVTVSSDGSVYIQWKTPTAFSLRSERQELMYTPFAASELQVNTHDMTSNRNASEHFRTRFQRHSNCMLYMRRMFKELEILLRLQSPDVYYSITDEEATRVLKCVGYDKEKVDKALADLMAKIAE